METKELSQVTVNSEGIDNSKKNNNSKALKVLSKNFNNVNNTLSDLAQYEAELDDELVDIKLEIANLTGKLKIRAKDIRNALKVIEEKRLLSLGERASYLKQINDLGGSVKRLDITKLINSKK